MKNNLVSQKYKVDGTPSHRYEGVRLPSDDAHVVILEAYFQRDDYDLGYVVFKKGDKFIEYYYDDRYYNIFAIYDVDDGALKGWYCNLARPATFSDDGITFVDLELDLWVNVDGSYLVLDEDEFAAADIADEERQRVRDALAELIGLAEKDLLPR